MVTKKGQHTKRKIEKTRKVFGVQSSGQLLSTSYQVKENKKISRDQAMLVRKFFSGCNFTFFEIETFMWFLFDWLNIIDRDHHKEDKIIKVYVSPTGKLYKTSPIPKGIQPILEGDFCFLLEIKADSEISFLKRKVFREFEKDHFQSAYLPEVRENYPGLSKLYLEGKISVEEILRIMRKGGDKDAGELLDILYLQVQEKWVEFKSEQIYLRFLKCCHDYHEKLQKSAF